MRNVSLLLGFVGSLVCLSNVLADPAQQLGAPVEPATTPRAASVSDTASAPVATGESWRYKRHNDTWWYWLPSERWVYWSVGRWVPFDPVTYRAPQPAPRRSHSYQGERVDRQYGAWGRVRYDRFGQPQYPYSRRKTGMRQLGAVPAYGGVRALPGWGGER